MTDVITGRHLDVLVSQIAEKQSIQVDCEKYESRGFAKISVDCDGDSHKADHVANAVAMTLSGTMGSSPRVTIVDEVVQCSVGIIQPYY